MEGLIGFYGLTDWWLSVFTEQERRYIHDRYNPLGFPSDTLVCGQVTSNQPVTEFLNGLSTWFRSKNDSHIARLIYDKMEELGRQQPMEGPGYYQGRHFTTYVLDVNELRRNGKLVELEKLLIGLVNATEAEDKVDRSGVAPWYYEELAKLHRKQKNYVSEVAILERYVQQKHAPGQLSEQLLQRLEKARMLLARMKPDSKI